MLRTAGEVGDGALMHPTNSDPRTLREVTRPALAAGAARAGRSAAETAIHACPFIATGRTPAELAAARENIRETLGFLYSTPAYWPALVQHGWGEVGERLHRLSRAGAWGELRGLVTDEMLAKLVPQGLYPEIADVLLEWYGGLARAHRVPAPRRSRARPRDREGGGSPCRLCGYGAGIARASASARLRLAARFACVS